MKVETAKCEQCGKRFNPVVKRWSKKYSRENRWRRRRFCSLECKIISSRRIKDPTDVVMFVDQGMHPAAIAEMYGVSKARIYGILREQRGR